MLLKSECGGDRMLSNHASAEVNTVANVVELPCPIGSDFWYVSSETLEVECEKEGIAGFVILEDEILALDKAKESVEIHTQWCCLTREEAEAFREQLLKGAEEEN